MNRSTNLTRSSYFAIKLGIGMATLILLMFVFSLLNNALSERIEVDRIVPEFSQQLQDQESVDSLDSSNNNILVASSFLKNSSQPSSTTSTAPPSLEPCPQYLNVGPYFHYARYRPCWLLDYDNGANCYCFSRITDSWANANLTCSRGNMSLIDFKDVTERSLIQDHVYLTPELKGYAYWTSGIYNESAHEWQWSSNGKSFDLSVMSSSDIQLLREEKKPKKKCLLSNYQPPIYFAPRYCASYGYRFICKRTLPAFPV